MLTHVADILFGMENGCDEMTVFLNAALDSFALFREVNGA